MKKTFFLGLIVGSLMLMSCSSAIAACATACTKSETVYTCTDITVDCVQDAITAATSGDTVLFSGDGSETWSTAVSVGKALTINGNGTTLTAGDNLTNGFFTITGFTDSTNIMRITDFTFDKGSYPTGRAIYATGGSGSDTLAKLRIDNNTFKFGVYQLEIGGCWGVIDNNTFYNASTFIQLNGGSRTQADASWVDLSTGTANALFVENNRFVCDSDDAANVCGKGNGFDASQGGKNVVRWNTWDYTNAYDSSSRAVLGFHGSAAGGCNIGTYGGYWQPEGSDCRRSPSVWEVYANYMTGKRVTSIFTARGGTGVVWNNVLVTDYAGTMDSVIYIREEEFYNFTPIRLEWPAEDQVHNIFIWGNTSKGLPVAANQIATDGYNTYCTENSTPYSCCSGLKTGTCDDGEAGAFLTKDREYFLHAPCGGSDETDALGNVCTHGKATFTGANGASDTYPTDGETYATSGTMTFSAIGDNAHYPYTPYTCPHPLTGLTGTCNSTLAGTSGYNVASALKGRSTGSGSLNMR